MFIPGLPEGVEVDRFGFAFEGEFCLLQGTIRKIAGIAFSGHAASFIVHPADGFEFIPRSVSGDFAAVKKQDYPRTISASFTVINASMYESVMGALGRLQATNIKDSAQ